VLQHLVCANSHRLVSASYVGANTEKCDVRTEPRARVGSHTHAFTLNPTQWVTKQHGVNKAEALYNELNLRHFEEV